LAAADGVFIAAGGGGEHRNAAAGSKGRRRARQVLGGAGKKVVFAKNPLGAGLGQGGLRWVGLLDFWRWREEGERLG
jgi:hypothetical protein